jgi:hypothetical protein
MAPAPRAGAIVMWGMAGARGAAGMFRVPAG